MLGRTHAAIGFLFAVFLFPLLNIKWYFFFPFVILGSILPDIDHEGSKINHILPLTKQFAKFFRHRGFFHSVFPIVFFLLLEYLFNLYGIGFSISIGYLSHLLSDCLTPLGIDFLHPAVKLKVEGFIPTGGLLEFVLFLSASVVAVIKFFSLIF